MSKNLAGHQDNFFCSTQKINFLHVAITAILTSAILCLSILPPFSVEKPCLNQELDAAAFLNKTLTADKNNTFNDKGVENKVAVDELELFQLFHQNLMKAAYDHYQDNILARKQRTRGHLKRCKADNIGCAKSFRMLFMAPTWPCPTEVHVGSWGEGGKWVCNITNAIPATIGTVYSIGSRGDPQFERSMNQKFGVLSHTFDPTMPQNRIDAVSNLSFVEFHNIGLSGRDNPEEEKKLFRGLAKGAQFMRIDQIMDMLNHTYVDVFKIDCEGCEVLFVQQLKRVTTRERPRFGQVLMEIHHANDPSKTFPTVEALEDLGYRLFHVEPNFFSLTCYELAYIHESLVAV